MPNDIITPGALGWTPGPVDPRDAQFTDFMAERPSLSGERRWHYEGQKVLDQGREGACVLFSQHQAANCEPKRRTLTNSDALAAYQRVTMTDEFKGNHMTGQSGTSLRSGAKEMKRLGIFGTYAFADDVDVLVSWVLNRGPITLGVDWYNSCARPEKDPATGALYSRVRPASGRRGGHAVAIVGASWNTGAENYVVLQNSWGSGWGYNGRVRVSEAGLRIWANSDHFSALTFVD